LILPKTRYIFFFVTLSALSVLVVNFYGFVIEGEKMTTGWLSGKKVIPGFLLGIGMIIIVNIASYYTNSVFVQSSKMVERAHIIVNKFNNILTDVEDAESAQRGYIITGDKNYLTIFNNELLSIFRNDRQLRELIVDNKQIEKFIILEHTIRQEIDSLKESIHLRQAKGFNQAAQGIRDESRRKISEATHYTIGELIAQEEILLENRSREAKPRGMIATIAGSIGSALALILIGIAVFTLRHQLRERARAQEKSQQIAKEWETTFNSIKDMISIQDNNFKFIRVNKAYANFLKMDEEELIGRKCYEVFHATAAPCQNCAQVKAIQSKQPCAIESFEPRFKLYIETTVSPILNDRGEITSNIHIIKDITERKELDKLKDEFVSTVSHEMRTPLTTIRESVSQVLDGILGPITDEQKEFLTICLNDSNRLKRIIDDLLDISRLEAGSFKIRKDKCDIVDIVKSVSSSFYPKVSARGLEIKTFFSHEKIEIVADKDRIGQILMNLIGNAVKFTSAGSITISVTQKNDIIECSVADTGVGIGKDDLPKVFTKFQQFGRIAGPGEKGTGLGLSIAKGLVERHGGKIWVESKPGEGTKFTFQLPRE